MARELKTHIKYKGKPLCGSKSSTRRLKYVAANDEPTCGNCQRATRT